MYPTYAHSGRNVSREAYAIFAVRVSKQRSWWNRYLRRSHPHHYGGVTAPGRHSMCKKPERKEFPARHGGTFADNPPTLFDARKRQMVTPKQSFFSTLTPFSTFLRCIFCSLGPFASS